MKKTFISISIILITLISISASAQVKSYIALYGGISSPQGDFAKSGYDNNQAGYAKRGATFGLDGAVYFYKNLAIGATISFQDQGKLTFDDAYGLAAGYTNAFAADNGSVTAVNRYHNWNILVGPQYSFEFSKFIVDVRASAGIIKSISSPELSIQLSGVPTQTDVFYQRSSSATIFGYGGNVGLRYKLSDGFMIGIKGAYIDSQGLTINNDGRTSNVGRVQTKQPISEFQTTIGFNIAF